MNKKIAFETIWRYIKFLASLALLLASVSGLYVIFALLSTASGINVPLPIVMLPDRRDEMERYWREVYAMAQEPLTRKAIFEIWPERGDSLLELSMDSRSPLAQEIIKGNFDNLQVMRPGPSERGMVETFFGFVSINYRLASGFTWEQPYWSADERTHMLTLHLKAATPITPASRLIDVSWSEPYEELSAPDIGNIEMRVIMHDVIFRRAFASPANIAPNEVTFHSRASAQLETVTPNPGLTRQEYVNNLGNITPPFFSRLLYALVEFAPLALLSAYAYGLFKSGIKIPTAFAQLTLGLFGVHFTLYFFMAHNDAYTNYFFSPAYVYVMSRLESFMEWDTLAEVTDYLRHAFTPLFVTVVCILFPLALPRLMDGMGVKGAGQSREENKKRGRLLLPLLEILPVAGALFSGYWLWQYAQSQLWMCQGRIPGHSLFIYWLGCSVPQWAPLLFALSMGILCTRWSLELMTTSLWDEKPNSLAAWIATFVILLMTVYPFIFKYFYWEWYTWKSWGWMAFNILFGALLLYQLGIALLRYAKAMQIPFDAARLSRWILALAFILAIPAYYGDGRSQNMSYQDDLARLFFAVDNIFIYIWVAAILWLLYQDGKTDLSLNKNTLWVGTLGAASILFNVTSSWMYIPAAFLLGWLALSWLMRRAQWEERHNLDHIFKQIVKMRAAMLQKISLLRMAEQALDALQKKKREKITAGDEDFTKARKGIEKHVASIERLRESPIKGVDHDFKHLPLAFGPKSTAWENGLHGAKWSALIALPWLVLNFVSFMRGTSFSHAYLLASVNSILSILMFWSGIGFVMGFFFPYLRGDSGLQKGIHLALAIILPVIPLSIIQYQTFENWQGFFLWAFQVFVVCILLGLFAFDYLTIRATGKNWETLLEIHGLFPVGIWTSSVLAGLAAAVASWIANPAQMQLWLGSAAQIILPVISQADTIFK